MHMTSEEIGITLEMNFPILDYDQINEGKIKREIEKLQKEFNLKRAMIMKTKRGFHVLFPFDKKTKEEINQIIERSMCDIHFKEFSRMTDIFCRLAGKYIPVDVTFIGFHPEIEGKTLFEKLNSIQNPFNNNSALIICLAVALSKVEIGESKRKI